MASADDNEESYAGKFGYLILLNCLFLFFKTKRNKKNEQKICECMAYSLKFDFDFRAKHKIEKYFAQIEKWFWYCGVMDYANIIDNGAYSIKIGNHREWTIYFGLERTKKIIITKIQLLKFFF